MRRLVLLRAVNDNDLLLPTCGIKDTAICTHAATIPYVRATTSFSEQYKQFYFIIYIYVQKS
jgi:hypothetical protein